jgi:NADPH:quinone reductase-like Zn-dependent oxidoreductase
MSTPNQYQKLQVQKLTNHFREATKIVTVPLNKPQEEEITIKIEYVGINASDINFTAGRYTPVNKTNKQYKSTYNII